MFIQPLRSGNTLSHPVFSLNNHHPQLLHTHSVPACGWTTHCFILCFPHIIIIPPLLCNHPVPSCGWTTHCYILCFPHIIIIPPLLCTHPVPSGDQITCYYILCFPHIIIVMPSLHTHPASWGDQKTSYHFFVFTFSPFMLSRVCCLVVSRPDNTQTGTPDTYTNRGHMATNLKKTNDKAGGW
jgi:hypothetical protein